MVLHHPTSTHRPRPWLQAPVRRTWGRPGGPGSPDGARVWGCGGGRGVAGVCTRGTAGAHARWAHVTAGTVLHFCLRIGHLCLNQCLDALLPQSLVVRDQLAPLPAQRSTA